MSKGKVQTVLGLVEPKTLGVTLTHEHLALRFETAYTPAREKERHNEKLPIAMENLGWIRQNPYSVKENLTILREKCIFDEMKYFKENGGGTIVENTTNGIDRDPEFLKQVSQKTGVQIVAGAGYYVDATHPLEMAEWTEEKLVDDMTVEITQGCCGTDIKCGVIGEIGCTWPLTDNEKKVLRATAQTSSDLRCPVIIHPGRNLKAPEEIVRVMQEAGGDMSNVVMSHLDRTLHTREGLVEFAEMGTYCEFDLFGIETSHYQLDLKTDMPSDAQRIERMKWLIDEGYEDKLLVAHDIHTKHRLMKYGGHGFSHILLNIIPKMYDRGYTKEMVNNILVNNPRRWLTFK